MARAFNQQEKEQIKAALMEKGRHLFSTYGLRKTNIKDLTGAVGISQGAFYLFFASKEELFFDILEEEENKLQQHFLQGLSRGGFTPDVFKELIRQSFQAIENNGILRHLYLHDDYRLLLRKLPPERINAHIQKDTTTLLPLIEEGQQQGFIINKNPEVIAGALRALFTLTLHRKEIGEEVYDETIQLLIDLVSDGLIQKGGSKND